jgi:hypothetical protein
MRRWAIPFSVMLLVCAYNAPAFCADADTCNVIVKIHSFVADSNAEAMYNTREAARKKALAGVKEKYKAHTAKLKELANQGEGVAKEVWEALSKFQANLEPCSICEHKYRKLQIDLTEFEKCKKRSCDPLNEARSLIFNKALGCKKGK